MIVNVNLEVSDEPLLSRRCLRCSSTDFRALLVAPLAEKDGRKLEYRAPGSKTDEVAYYGGDQCQTAIPLAICLACKRLCALI